MPKTASQATSCSWRKMNSHTVIIASKGRAGTSQSISRVLEEELNHILVVEPQDGKAYAEAYPDAVIVLLLENDKGISYARQACLDYAREQEMEYFWMMDDDIKQMYLTSGGKNIKFPFGAVLYHAETLLTEDPEIGVGALEYQQYSWSAKKDVTFGSYCDQVVLINVEATRHINYRPNCKEDRDFVLQCLQRGLKSARASRCAFSSPKNGTNKGGLHEAYKGGLENHWSARMVELWPGVCERITKKDGRPDVKIHWKLMSRR